jgi:hypothetical protein
MRQIPEAMVYTLETDKPQGHKYPPLSIASVTLVREKYGEVKLSDESVRRIQESVREGDASVRQGKESASLKR